MSALNTKVITPAQIIRANTLLSSVISKDEDGVVTYLDGYSDLRVAKEIGVTQHQIARIRQQLFGHLGVGRGRSAAKQELADQVKALLDRVQRLEVEVDRLTSAH